MIRPLGAKSMRILSSCGLLESYTVIIGAESATIQRITNLFTRHNVREIRDELIQIHGDIAVIERDWATFIRANPRLFRPFHIRQRRKLRGFKQHLFDLLERYLREPIVIDDESE